MTLIKLNETITKCRQCKRLVNFREKIAKEKRKQYINENYWGKPITGYGDPDAKLLMIGLFDAGLSNQSNSIEKNDGLKLYNAYLTTALKCVPPEDKPTSKELKTCFAFFKKEKNYLRNIKVILALGKIAFDACLNFYREDYEIKNKNYKFSHGCKFQLPDKKILVGCYHPSPRNVNTGRINIKKMVNLLNEVKKITLKY